MGRVTDLRFPRRPLGRYCTPLEHVTSANTAKTLVASEFRGDWD
jgi:hypothetical protein